MPEIFERMLSLFKSKQLVEEIMSTEDFQKIMLGFDDKRLDILQGLLSLLSEDYIEYFKKCPDLEVGLAEKLHKLEFVKRPENLSFLLGKLPLADQKLVLKKVLKAIEYVQLATNQGPIKAENESSSCRNQKNIDIKKTIPKDTGRGKTCNFYFDLEKANENLEEADILIKQESFIYKGRRQEGNEPSNLPQTDACVTQLTRLTLGGDNDSSEHYSEPVSSDLNNAIEKLHRALKTSGIVQEDNSFVGKDTARKVDLRITNEDILILKKNSKILQLNKLCSVRF